MDYYSILGIARNTSPEDIKKAYKKLAMQHHPDRGGDVTIFQQVQEAYETLSDPIKKQQYDNPQPRHHQWNSQNFQDIFRQQRPRNRDITIAAKMDLKDVFTGKNLIANYRLNSGRVETVTIDIPAGARNGDTIRFQGLGDDTFGGPRGNLFVKVQINEPKGYARDGMTLYQEVDVNVVDMITGTVYNITTLDNKNLSIKIPPGTKANTKFNIPGYGIPKLHQNEKRGNLIIVVSPYIPKVQDQNVLRKLKKLRKNLDK
jgi:curved DNA-binding protein